MLQKCCRLLLVNIACAVIFTSTVVAGPFNIDMSFTPSFTSFLSETQQSVFTQAENYWENAISGYQAGIEIGSLGIMVDYSPVDGEYNRLGWGGPTNMEYQGGLALATEGIMTFDSADFERLYIEGRLLDVVIHEMAHVIGFGTLWKLNDLYVNGSYQYTGAAALAAYQAAYDASATWVPVENDGGAGTEGAHWEEDIFGNELMTGWLDLTNPVGSVTLGSFVDIGYVLTSVPAPSAFLLLGVGLLGLTGRRRKA